MSDPFTIVSASSTALDLKLGPHALDGDADDLFRYVTTALGSGRHRRISLDARDAHVASLEGVAVLMRLLKSADAAGVSFVLDMPHPALQRKLELTGVLDLLTDGS
jgi:anti-anti-sigma regulatory factor